MKTFKFSFPTRAADIKYMSIDLWRTVKKYAGRIVFYARGGFLCDQCGTRMFYRSPSYESHVHGKRLILQASSFSSKKCICSDCLKHDLLTRDVWKEECECFWCGETKTTTRWFNDYAKRDQIPVFFGSGWWNGHDICPECLADGMNSITREHSDMMVLKQRNGLPIAYYANELGILDKRKH
jgi:hypothetical protein